jgi:hypothetical protein
MMVQGTFSPLNHVGIAIFGFSMMTLQSLIANILSTYFVLAQCYKTQTNVMRVNKYYTQTNGLVRELGM